jgi:excisionase family DNA binding protein
MTEPLVLTVEEAARLLRIGRGTAYEAVRTGDIPSVRVGRRVLVPRHALLSLLNADATAANGRAGKMPKDARHGPY